MKLFTKSALAGIACAVLIGVNGCKKPIDDLDIIVNTGTLSTTPTLVQFVNANTSSTTKLPENFKVTITGAGASYLQVDGGGNNFTAIKGYLPLSLVKGTHPSKNNPVTFCISATLPGFAPISQTVTLTNDNATAPIIKLVEYAKPVSGTTAVTRETTISTSTGTTAVVNINTPVNNDVDEATRISIPSGTKMLDAQNNAITATQLSSKVVYFSTGNNEAAAAFPGGFDMINAIGPNGQPINNASTFVTAGLLSIDMTAGSTPVKGFSKPVTISMDINPDLVNPQTKQTVKVGDIIPVWSLNEQTGQWKYESTTTIARNSSNKLSVSFPITHLSAWCANWYSTNCGSDLNVTLHIPNTNEDINGDYQISLVTANNQPVASYITSNINDGFKAVLSNFPSDAGDLKVIVYSNTSNGLTKLGETSFFSACGRGSVDVTLSGLATVDYVKTNVKVTARCTNQQVVAQPSTWLTLKDNTSGQSINIYMTNGVSSANLINGHSYSISTTFAGKNYNSASFKLDKATGVNIPSVDGLSGTANYDQTADAITVEAKFVLENCN
ncbi:hypothetical protein [Mucilaginibacter terrae]|uniref:Uncharacterized protein n=1 Tax=Mucilaginibacter terrae TaxID=1955052 RepID=A0ABU3GV20_9SPHI|nr:hypothetical protein [Mucilaginibacter terrae]MDT3403620.1 hypothetical protein [Mucilaginibacter terrae]